MNGARYFLDTNIVVYLFDDTAPRKAVRATQLVEFALATGCGIVSYQVVQEYCNTMLRKLRQGFRAHDLRLFIELTLAPILAVQPSLPLVLEALQLQKDSSIPWYDALIVAAALEAKCAVLYSEDFQHGRRFGDLRVENPFL